MRWLLLLVFVLGVAGGAAADPCAAGARCDEQGVLPAVAPTPATPAAAAAPVTPTVVAAPATTPAAASAPSRAVATAPAAPLLPALDTTAPAVASTPDEGPSLVAAVLRLLGSVVVIAVLLAACIVGYRRFVQHAAARPNGMLGWVARATEERDPDLVHIGSRRYLGARDSIAVVHAGPERFLIGISAAGISLISRLESPAATTEPTPATFGDALAQAAAPAIDTASSAERALRAAVERSRARLARLGPVPEEPRA